MTKSIFAKLAPALVAAFLSGAMCMTGSCSRSSTPATSSESGELVVFAAASLTEAFGEIQSAFQAANPGSKVTFNFAGSQQLAQQIGQGASCDVFASANGKQMDAVVATGRIDAAAARTFVRNRLVVITPKDNPAKLTDLAGLAKPGLKLVLAATEVPVGQYSLDMLDKAEKEQAKPGLKDAVLENVVSNEQDVKAVLAKVVLGEADAGVVYLSDVSQKEKEKVTIVDVPDTVNVVATYPIAVLKDSKHADLAKKFVDYVLSSDGQKVLMKYGFTSPAAPAGN